VCCSAFQCVAVGCSGCTARVMSGSGACVAVQYSVLQSVAARYSVLLRVKSGSEGCAPRGPKKRRIHIYSCI